MLYRILLFAKLVAVLVYAGGLAAASTNAPLPERKRAVHRIASPALLVVWLLGFALAEMRGWRLTELWLVLSLAASFASIGALVTSVSTKGRSPVAARRLAVGALGIVLALMVFRPTWADVAR